MEVNKKYQNENTSVSFSDSCIVSCGILQSEIKHLQNTGFLNAKKILFTAPGLHEWQSTLKKQLTNQLKSALLVSEKIIVLYGERCFMDPNDPSRVTDTLIKEECPTAVRINASYCVDMLISTQDREKIAGQEKVHWITPGWLKHWDFIFKDWDKGKANEMFPKHDRIIVVDPLGYYDTFITENPEKLLEISDWTGVPVESVPVTFERLKELLQASMMKLAN